MVNTNHFLTIHLLESQKLYNSYRHFGGSAAIATGSSDSWLDVDLLGLEEQGRNDIEQRS